jgi:hypothetical protein
VTSEKQNLERQLQQQGSDHTELRTSYSDLEVSQLKAEIEACVNRLYIPLQILIKNKKSKAIFVTGCGSL